MLQHQKKVVRHLPITLARPCEIRMEVLFGTPSQNCIGSGVCMVMNHPPSKRTLFCPHAPAWISYQQGMLVFRFAKHEVLRLDAQARFDSPWFLVQEAFEMPRYAARQIGMGTQWVMPGLYAVEETQKDWVLRFNLL